MDTANNKKGADPNKTFIEGEDARTGVHAVPPPQKVDATKIRTNPYAQPSQGASNLPSGNESIALGSGVIVGLLGSGGMARVYKIWNEKLEVFRAVKILIPSQQGDLRNRFETEAKITAKLHHPNIVEIYNVGDWQGLPYLEMELIDGHSLEGLIGETGKLPPAVCSAISIFVIRALAYAHGQDFLIYGKTYQGIIHRDLKPANIMISSAGDVKLMDFGIARPTETSLHTVDGNIVGTMQYLSPEQMDGVSVDARADIYAFGAILYEMLTGTKTFPQETITNLMKQKITNEYRKFASFDFAIPPGLAKISQKCLQLARENRFPNAGALLKELEIVHRSLSSDPPETVLKAFIKDPSSVQSSFSGKKAFRVGLKILFPIIGAALIGCLVVIFIATGPKQSSSLAPTPATVTSAPPSPAAPSEGTRPTPSTPAPAMPQTALQPLDARQSASPALQEKQPQPEKQKSKPVQTAKKTPAPAMQKQKSKGTKNEPEPAIAANPSASAAAAEEQSPLARLEKAYESNDYYTIGKAAMQKAAYNDAILALTHIPGDHPNRDNATILLLEACLEIGKLQEATTIARNERINDAEFYFLSGKVSMKQGRNKEALDLFQSALTKPCAVRNVGEVRMDALYYTALSYREIYANDPSPDNKGLTLQAWLVVKNAYRNNPNHSRFKRAVEEMAGIK